jgi:serine/threonine protein kinase
MSEPDATTVADFAVLRAAAPGAGWVAPLSRSPHARVYRVHDAAGTRRVVKIVAPEQVAHAVALHAQLERIRGAVPLLASGTAHGVGYLVHPYYESTVADVITGGARTGSGCQHLLRPVAEALETLHAAGFVHADVTPANIAVTDTGSGVLLDLDQALPLGTSAVRATPEFAAPELISSGALSPETDRYGLAITAAGVLLGTAVTGADRAQWLARLPDASRAAVAADLDDAPHNRIFAPVQLIDLLAHEVTDAPVAGPLPAPQPVKAPSDEPAEELVMVADRFFGPVDARARTRDRVPLRLHDAPVLPVLEQDEATSFWRRPALLFAVLAAVVLAVVAVLLLV